MWINISESLLNSCIYHFKELIIIKIGKQLLTINETMSNITFYYLLLDSKMNLVLGPSQNNKSTILKLLANIWPKI